MQPLTVLASTVASVMFTEVVKKQGETLGKLATDKVTELINFVRAKFKEEEVGGVLKRAEENPETENIQKFEEELVSVMEIDKNKDFTQQLRKLVEELKKQGVITDSNIGSASKYNIKVNEMKGSIIGDDGKINNKWA